MSFGSRSSVRFQRLLCAGLGVRVRRHGELAPRAGLIVANHVSWLDIPVLGSLAPMSFLAKKEVGDHPLGRRLVALQGAVYVDRGRRFKIPAVNADMARTLQNGSPVVLFAEATTGDGNRLSAFPLLAFRGGSHRGPRAGETRPPPAGLPRLFAVVRPAA